MRYDVYISHASEDKDEVARPLARRLQESGVKVWLDESELELGDDLRRSIKQGLSQSKFGVVIFSHEFFSKEWTQIELDGLFNREANGCKVILPVWHNISREEVAKYSPILAGKLAASTEHGIERVAQEILRVIGKPTSESSGVKRRHVNSTSSINSRSVPEQTSLESWVRANRQWIIPATGFMLFAGILWLMALTQRHDSQSRNSTAIATPTPSPTPLSIDDSRTVSYDHLGDYKVPELYFESQAVNISPSKVTLILKINSSRNVEGDSVNETRDFYVGEGITFKQRGGIYAFRITSINYPDSYGIHLYKLGE